MSARSALTIATALGFALSAGVFYAFSTFVMPALGRLPAPSGIAAMQSINVAAINLPFLGVLFGSGAVACVLAVLAIVRRSEPGTAALVAGTLVYVIGTLGVTMAANVPLNDALADARPDHVAGADLWAQYLVVWTTWNHVRALAGLVAAALLVLSVIARAQATTVGVEGTQMHVRDRNLVVASDRSEPFTRARHERRAPGVSNHVPATPARFA